jgi:hypothetical protein
MENLTKFRPEEVKVEEFSQKARTAIREDVPERAWEVWEYYEHELRWVDGREFVEGALLQVTNSLPITDTEHGDLCHSANIWTPAAESLLIQGL